MATIKQIGNILTATSLDRIVMNDLNPLYPDNVAAQIPRYQELFKYFTDNFGERNGETYLIDTPGRIEVDGNHTDHNGGRVLAASVGPLSNLMLAMRNDEQKVRLHSKDYFDLEINLSDLPTEAKDISKQYRKAALAIGVITELSKVREIGGLDAAVLGGVPDGSGLSSSAGFATELLTAYNDAYDLKLSKVEMAQIAQKSELYMNKECGLMDQMACLHDGIITIDFSNPLMPEFEVLEKTFADLGYTAIVVNPAEQGHAELTPEYNRIRHGMEEVAGYFEKSNLSQVSYDQFKAEKVDLIRKFGPEKVFLADHFYEENERVKATVSALKAGDAKKFLININESGDSSRDKLKNYWVHGEEETGPIEQMVVSTREYARKQKFDIGSRVTGGGFRGGTLHFVPTDKVDAFTDHMAGIYGADAVHKQYVRPGATRVLKAV